MPEKFCMPVRKSPACDPQRHLVYRMEMEAIGARIYGSLTRKLTRRLVRSVCRNYGIPAPRVVWTNRLGRWAAEWSDAGGGRIAFSTSKLVARDFLTVTHELAHHLHYCLAKDMIDEQESHGPEFMACHMSILDVCRMLPVQGMRAVCKAWGVKYHDPGTRCSLTKLIQICRRKSR